MERYCYYIPGSEDVDRFAASLQDNENSPATIAKYVRDVHAFCHYLQRNCREETFSKKEVLEFKEWLCANYQTSSVNSMLAACNRFLSFLGMEALRVRRLRQQRPLFISEKRSLNLSEYKALVQYAYRIGKDSLGLSMETLAMTGARVSEMRYFTVEQVSSGAIRVINKGKERTIPIPDMLRRRLLQYAKRRRILSGCILVSRKGNPIDRSNLWKEMKSLARKAGIAPEKVFPHNLRHLFARLYYQRTGDLFGLADVLGHSSINITRIYTADTEKRIRENINRMGSLFLNSNKKLTKKKKTT